VVGEFDVCRWDAFIGCGDGDWWWFGEHFAVSLGFRKIYEGCSVGYFILERRVFMFGVG